MATAALRYLRANGYQFNLPSYFCASSKGASGFQVRKNPDTFSLFPSKILSGKPGESKSGTVYLGRIIPEVFECPCPLFIKVLQRVPFQGTKKETDHAAGVSGNHGVIIACLWKKLAGEVINTFDDVSV